MFRSKYRIAAFKSSTKTLFAIERKWLWFTRYFDLTRSGDHWVRFKSSNFRYALHHNYKELFNTSKRFEGTMYTEVPLSDLEKELLE